MMGRSRVIVCSLLATACFVLAGLTYVSRRARQSAQQMQCTNSLRQIGVALRNYDASHRGLPPSVTFGSDGNAWHSWRALVLPQLAALQPVYEFDACWDGPRNRRLLNGHIFRLKATGLSKGQTYVGPIDLSPFFQCNDSEEFDDYHANIVAITGTETLWPSDGVCTLEDVPDGAGNTILLAESLTLQPFWSEPVDLCIDAMSLQVNCSDQPSISANHPDGPAVLMADCSVFRLSPELPPEILRALLTRDGGEPYNVRDLVRDGLIFATH